MRGAGDQSIRTPRAWRGTRFAPAAFALSLVAVLLAGAAALLGAGPVAQDLRYHALADDRTILGIPNFADVASNLPFLVVGAAGLAWCVRRRGQADLAPWTAVFAGTALIAVGSAWYHWAPSSATLVWDRLPMAIAFTGLFAAVVGEHTGERIGLALLGPALVAGVGSVVWWALRDDLRPYVVVQAAPILAVPLALALARGRYTHRRYYAYALGLYLVAKLAETGDRAIFEWTGRLLSGHSLKHLLAAGSVVALYAMLRLRRRVEDGRRVRDGTRLGNGPQLGAARSPGSTLRAASVRRSD
jgi:hypothetical protein